MRDGNLATEVRINRIEGVFVDRSGNLFIADGGNSRIRRVDAETGIITTVAGGGFPSDRFGDGGLATNAMLNLPIGIFLNKDGDMFIISLGDNRIRRVDRATGIITTVAITVEQGGFVLGGPGGVFVDKSDNIFITDSGRIRRIDAETGIITTVAGNGKTGLGGRGFSGDGVLATESSLNKPSGLFVDSTGDIFIADTGNGRIRKVSFKQGETGTPEATQPPTPTPTPSMLPTLFPTQTPTPTPTPTSIPTPSIFPTLFPTQIPTATPEPMGKSFTFNCNHKFSKGPGGLERLVLELGVNEACTLKLTNLVPGRFVEVSTNLRTGFRSSIKVSPIANVTDSNGEIEFTISAIDRGIDWIAWAIHNENGIFDFSNKAYNAGLAWGLFVEVK